MKPPAELRLALTERALPGVRLTWLDLQEQCAIERGVALRGALERTRSRSACHARRHAWGALLGAGCSVEEIAEVYGVAPETVQIGIRRVAERLRYERRMSTP